MALELKLLSSALSGRLLILATLRSFSSLAFKISKTFPDLLLSVLADDDLGEPQPFY